MKKLPRPEVFTHPNYNLSDDRTVVRLEWDFFAIEMFDDEAMVLARSIYDALEVPNEDRAEPPTRIATRDSCHAERKTEWPT